jgi:squalene-associated FAD-dependent desaturase
MQNPHGNLGKESPHVLIVGGGLAGLAASAMLSNYGCKVTVLETRPKTGGRADSYLDPVSDELVDHCQHISMGCCTNLSHFCRWMGLEQFFQDEENLYFMTPDGKVSHLKGDNLPAPLHLARSFLKASYLTYSEKIRLGLAFLLLRLKEGDESVSFGDWLLAHFQTPSLIERFWKPVLVSALNTPIEKASFKYCRKVVVDSFFADRKAYRLKLPSLPLAELFGPRLFQRLKGFGVTIRLGSTIRSVLFDNEKVTGVLLQNGEILEADHVVLAVPFQRLKSLLGEKIDEPILGLQSSPITSVHMWFDQRITDLPHVVMLDTLSHWLFYRGKNSLGEHFYQVVISASADALEMGYEAIQAKVLAELHDFFGAMNSAKVLRAKVVTEKKATFASSANVDYFRPDQATRWPNLFLAGDFTKTGWPATMEGAVRSGYLAAEKLLKSMGVKARCLQPDLNGVITVD